MPRPDPNAPPPACLNCGQPFGDSRPRYCPACGQESVVKSPTLREFAQQFGGAYFSTEGALWRTLGLLLFKPGELTRQYLAGRRRHYVLPLRLYLTISVVTLLLVRLAASSSLQMESPRAADARPLRNVQIGFGVGRAGVKDGVFYCDDLPAWLCKRLQRRIDLDPKAMVAQVEQIKERFVGNLGGAMFVLLPSFALWLKLAYLNRRMRYTEHLVFALHVHAFWFVALALTLANQGWLSLLACAAVPVYALAAMRRVYGGRRWPRVLRALAVSVLYGLTLVLTLASVAVWSLLA